MKREMIRILVALVLMLSLATVASAETVKLTGFPYGLTTVHYKLNNIADSASAGQFIITRDGIPTWAFCVDLIGKISQGTNYSVTPIPVTGNYVQAAWLADQWRAGADTSDESAALQAAIWRAVYGSSFVLDAGNSTSFVNLYNNYIGALSAPGTFTGVNYVYLDGYQVGSETRMQGLITGVPEPMTMLLLGLGLVGLAGLRRKE